LFGLDWSGVPIAGGIERPRRAVLHGKDTVGSLAPSRREIGTVESHQGGRPDPRVVVLNHEVGELMERGLSVLSATELDEVILP